MNKKDEVRSVLSQRSRENWRPASGDRAATNSPQPRGVTFDIELIETMQPRMLQLHARDSSSRTSEFQDVLQRLSPPHVTTSQLTSPKKFKQLSNSKQQQLRRRKRTLSLNKLSIMPDVKVDAPLTARNFQSTIEAAEKPPQIYGIARPAPAKELEPVWNGFIAESRKRHSVNNIIKDLYRYPYLHMITVLSLERAGIEKIFEYLKPCQNLVALYMKQNRVITRDLVQIQHLTALRTVDLSSNRIHFLPDEEHLAKLQKLQYLQLHNNEIVGYLQLKNLTCLKELKHLTLQGNPCSKVKGYRQLLVDAMPQLRSLDAFIVMDYERQDIAQMFPPENIKKHKLLELNRFRPFNKDYSGWQCSKFVLDNKLAIDVKQINGETERTYTFTGD